MHSAFLGPPARRVLMVMALSCSCDEDRFSAFVSDEGTPWAARCFLRLRVCSVQAPSPRWELAGLSVCCVSGDMDLSGTAQVYGVCWT